MTDSDDDPVIITDALARRPSRAPDHAGEARALTQLGEAMSTQPDTVLQRLVESTIALTGCGSAGISILQPGGTQGMFHWVATAGAWAPYRGGTMPREESPCGAVLAQESILLMRRPERLFPALRQADPPIGEGLLAPFRIAGVPVGTVWAIKHGADERFEAEDARLLETLARFASAAHQMALALRRAEADRLESDTRLRALAHASSDAFYVMSADMGELRGLSGRAFLTDTTSPSRAWLRDYIPPEDHGPMLAAIRTAIRHKRVFELEHRVRRADGTIGWAVSRAVPIIGADGAIAEWFGAASDISARKRTEAALHDSEARFRQFSDESPNVLWIRNAETLRLEFASPAFDVIYGVSGPQRGGDARLRAWVSLIVAEDRRRVLAGFRRIRAGQRTELEFRIRRPADGAIRWIRNTDFPLRDAAGQVRWVGGIGADITEARELGERRGVLVAELQHRTRNLIAVVRSLADRTLATAPTLDDFGRRFRLRLSALSRVQGLLSHLVGGSRVTFDALLHTELVAHGMIDGTSDDAVDAGADGRAERVTLSGPAGVPLRSGTVQTLALALHELATNAVKYGALATPGGRLAVTWHVASAAADGEPWLHVAWQETGVTMPAPDAPARGGGYGRELIERALPYQLKARTTYELGDDGVRCTIAVPISQATPVPDAER